VNELAFCSTGMIQYGIPHDGSSGGPFDDAVELQLKPTTYCTGVKFFYQPDYLFAGEFIYRKNDSITLRIRGGHRDPTRYESSILSETFMMEHEERINKVTWYAGTHFWVGANSTPIPYVLGIQFYTTTGRTSGLYGSNKGEPYTEMYEGFTLGYPKDKCGFLVDMLQFVWYSQVE
jgi:hypothetical protein